MTLPKLADIRIGIIGLGYVGLPLAVYLARHFPVLSFDIDRERVTEVSRGIDRTREVTEEEFSRALASLTRGRCSEPERREFLHRHYADAGRPGQACALIAASQLVGTAHQARHLSFTILRHSRRAIWVQDAKSHIDCRWRSMKRRFGRRCGQRSSMPSWRVAVDLWSQEFPNR